MNKNILNFAIALLFGFSALHAQNVQNSESPAPQTGAPLELPDVIITGKEQVEIPNSQKKMPSKPKKLNIRQLEFLNPLEKNRESILETEKMPSEPISRVRKNGFLNGELGRFTTGVINGGYGFIVDSYSLFADAGIDFSSGHTKNAEYKKIYGRLTSDYIAPDKFYIFGGSRTRSQFFVNSNAYNLYADTNNYERTVNSIKIKVESEGSFEGYDFTVGGNWFNQTLNQNNLESSENNINAFVNVKTNYSQYELGAGANFDFGTFRGNSVNFIQIDALCGLNYKEIILELKGGIQTATNSADINRSGLFLRADGKYDINESFFIKAGIFSGLEKAFFNDMLAENPYISALSKIDFAYNRIGAQAFLYFNPNPSFNATFGLKYNNYDRFAIYQTDSSGCFKSDYMQLSKLTAIAEANFRISQYDLAFCGISFNNANLIDSSKTAPFIPSFKLSAHYYKDWRNMLSTKIGIDFYSNRYADISNNKTIDGFINLNLSCDYKINDNLNAFLKIDNLTNSNIMIWEGYKERGIFASIGALWRFN